MILTSELSIKLAADYIKESNILPDVDLKFIRYYADETSAGDVTWNTVKMIENGVDAVIGDMASSSTEISAGLTGMFQIPQCSCASATSTLSNKAAYPYFFRTTANVVLYGEAFIDWTKNMGWKRIALIYTLDGPGQQALEKMEIKASMEPSIEVDRLPLYSSQGRHVNKTLKALIELGTRIVAIADLRPTMQMSILKEAESMGLLKKGWVWIVMNNISPVFRGEPKLPKIEAFDGLMFASGLWDFTGEPRFDSLKELWKTQTIPDGYIQPERWEIEGLSFNGPSAYSCTELLALGLNRALDIYPGGRSVGLMDLRKRVFNSSNMTPSFYNFSYTGPGGLMLFNDTGDLSVSSFDISFMKNGIAVPYALVKLNHFELNPNVTIEYLGNTTEKPSETIMRYAMNSNIYEGYGLFVFITCVIGFSCCVLMFVLVFCFRHLKPIMIASPFFCYLQITGLAMMYVGIVLCLGKPTRLKCILLQLFLSVGFSLTIGSMIAKNYRIYRIFQNVFTVRTTRLRSYYLARIVAVFTILTILPLVTWFSVYPLEIDEYTLSRTTFCWICSYPTAEFGNWGYITMAEIMVLVWGYLLILLSTFLAFKTRNISSKWSETSQIAYVSYNSGIAALISCPGFFLSLDDYKVASYLKISSVLFAVTFSLLVLYFPKFIIIMRVILKETTKFSMYRMNADSEVELTKPSYSSSLEENLNLNLVAKNLFDFTVQAHEGVLPVKKMARLEFFSIWELRHIILVPMKRFFVLTDKTKKNATLHSYTDCEIIPSEESNHHSFRVRTTVGLVFLFQVSDNAALERWVTQSATFGIENTAATSSVAQPSLAAHSSFYAPSALGSQQMHDTPESALHNRSTSAGFIDPNIDSTANTGSFGVKSSWPRYP
ncbi:hypothetical protein INT48_000143 [Thamnidium elegans]|uniref:G-protein coupled receptors family 3 profile domain-containing protein n=1 Tax=Thamnidium elegans TaxID=101142 RepID=A0A8H7W2X8_9FUNG|nr:hypothetical protein INT48_000143 [Thamnidium elegans]